MTPLQERETPLKSKIEELLTEARVVIPGGQALLGFQLIATLSKSFAEFPLGIQYLHAVGLCAVALSVLLLMTPAAVHRIAYSGEDSLEFFRIGSKLVVSATLPLALGLAGDIAVVFYRISKSGSIAAIAGILSLLFDCRLAGLSAPDPSDTICGVTDLAPSGELPSGAIWTGERTLRGAISFGAAELTGTWRFIVQMLRSGMMRWPLQLLQRSELKLAQSPHPFSRSRAHRGSDRCGLQRHDGNDAAVAVSRGRAWDERLIPRAVQAYHPRSLKSEREFISL